MVPFIIDIEQAYFGGVFKRDVLIPILRGLKHYEVPSLIYQFIHILIRECSRPTIKTFKELYKRMGFKNVNQFREFLELMLSFGKKVRDKKAKTNVKDLQYLAQNYLSYLEELKVS